MCYALRMLHSTSARYFHNSTLYDMGHVCEEEKPIHITFDGFSFHRCNIDLLQKDIINYSFGNFAGYDRFNQIP